MTITMTTTFREIKNKKSITVRCCLCQSLITKVLMASQTINPFNQKTVPQIREENKELIGQKEAEYRAEKHVCYKCRNKMTPDFQPIALNKDDIIHIKKCRKKLRLLNQQIGEVLSELRNKHACKRVMFKGREAIIDNFDEQHMNIRYIRKNRKGLTEEYDYVFEGSLNFGLVEESKNEKR